MVIDAQPTVRLGVREVLGQRYEVEEAENGNGALELLTSVGDFDVAIVDLGLANGSERGGDLSGMAAIRALRQAQPGLGIVAHGPEAQHHAATEAIKAGATAYVVKSSSVEELNRAVDAALEAERSSTRRPGRPGRDPRSRAASARSFSSTPTASRPRASQSASA